MKRLTTHAAILFCFLALSVSLSQQALADDPTPKEFSELSYTENTTIKEPMVIKPTTPGQTYGSISVSKDKAVFIETGGGISGDGMSFLKSGAGDLHFNVANTYTGDTYIFGGRLLINGDSSLGATSGNILLNNGSLRAKNTFSTARTITIYEKGGGIEVANTSTFTIDGKISGIGDLFKSGDGIMVLTNTGNNFTGDLVVAAGTAKLTAAGSAGKGAIDLRTNGKLDLSMPGGSTVSNDITGTGAITKNEAGKVTLGGTLIQAKTLEVKTGELAVSNYMQVGTATIAKGATMSVGTLRFANKLDFNLKNDGTFNYRDIQVVGSGNKLSSSIPSAANKNLSFVLSATTAPNDTMLAVSGNSLDVKGANVQVAAAAELASLNKGDSVTLIDKTTGAVANLGEDIKVTAGATTYTFTTQQGTVDPSGTQEPTDVPLTLTLQDSYLNGGKDGSAKAYLESALAALQTVAGANQFMGTVGMREAVNASQGDDRSGVNAIAAFRGTYQEVDTGSSIEGFTYNLMGAMTYKILSSLGATRVGFFAEGGWGRFDTFNSSNGRDIEGDSDISYAGGGILLRHDLPIGLYAEGTFRYGKVDGDFSSSHMGTGAAYESDVPYYGGHLGIGYQHIFAENHHLDVFGKMFWTHKNDDDVKTKAGEKLKIDEADSLVSHLGARYSYALPYNFIVHAAAAWEHEFDGEQTGKLNGKKVSAPDMGGSSAVGEVGIRFSPAATGFHVDLATHGSLGTRESIGGNVSFGYEF